LGLFPFLWDFEGDTDTMSASDAQRELLKRLRAERGYETVADMLDPKGFTYWKLELRQRRRGKRTVGSEEAHLISESYRMRIECGTPKKTIIGELAKQSGVPDTTIREIIRRATGKKSKR